MRFRRHGRRAQAGSAPKEKEVQKPASIVPSILLSVALILMGVAIPSVRGAGGLTVDVVTWDVMGLDSNDEATGPDTFPLGARICNTTSTEITSVTSTLTWGTTNAYVNLVDASGEHSLGTIDAGTCVDTYYTILISRNDAARGTTRDYSIAAAGSGGASGSIANRRITVENLVSQNRNTTQKISGVGGCNADFTVCDPAPSDLVVGEEVVGLAPHRPTRMQGGQKHLLIDALQKLGNAGR